MDTRIYDRETYDSHVDEDLYQKYNKKCGIYGIYVDDTLFYIGRSKNLISRWMAHRRSTLNRDDRSFNEAKYQVLREAYLRGLPVECRLIEPCNECELKREEWYFINTFKPVLNTIGVRKFDYMDNRDCQCEVIHEGYKLLNEISNR